IRLKRLGGSFSGLRQSDRHVLEINGMSKEKKRILVQLQNWL
ncbi:hypothetical protein AVEN_134849-1, partial [Araneus ventricosus]